MCVWFLNSVLWRHFNVHKRLGCGGSSQFRQVLKAKCSAPRVFSSYVLLTWTTLAALSSQPCWMLWGFAQREPRAQVIGMELLGGGPLFSVCKLVLFLPLASFVALHSLYSQLAHLVNVWRPSLCRALVEPRGTVSRGGGRSVQGGCSPKRGSSFQGPCRRPVIVT